MPYKINENCISCGECVRECPADAIDNLDSGNYHIHKNLCADCKACLDVCPVNAIEYFELP